MFPVFVFFCLSRFRPQSLSFLRLFFPLLFSLQTCPTTLTLLDRHARTHLPKYAVPIFVRQIKERSATHNNKQDKVPLKKAGIDPNGMEGNPVLWISDHGKGDEYVPFTSTELEALRGGQAKL